MVENWNEKAFNLYSEGKKINEIATELKLSRKTISKYINSLPCSTLSSAKDKRKEISKERRKEQKKAYRENNGFNFAGISVQRQHEIDVLVLSRERYFD